MGKVIVINDRGSRILLAHSKRLHYLSSINSIDGRSVFFRFAERHSEWLPLPNPGLKFFRFGKLYFLSAVDGRLG